MTLWWHLPTTNVFYYSTFGLRNSGATFQRMMDQIFGDLPFCLVYVDDILIYSNNQKDHAEHLRSVLQLLQANGLVVRLDKCVFGVSTVDFLGHEINAKGIRPLQTKVNVVANFPRPATIKSAQEFLGMINYYHRFIPRAADILSPLYDAISGDSKTLTWGTEQDKSFQATKDALVSAATLSSPLPDVPLYLISDASNIAIGAVLKQEIHGAHQPLGFFSRKLHKPERRYSTFDNNQTSD